MLHYPLFINDQWTEGNEPPVEIHAPFDDRRLALCHRASEAQMDEAIAAAWAARHAFAHTTRLTRKRLLESIRDGIRARSREFVQVIIDEAGKPRQLAEAEVARAVQTFTLAAEECTRFGGEFVPMDIDLTGQTFRPTQVEWFSRGPVLAITPFNFPLNLVAHKVAPAIATGSPVILKPAPQAPGAAHLLAELVLHAVEALRAQSIAIPPAIFQTVHASNDVAGLAVADPRITVLSFTGSDTVGWQLQGRAVRKRVCLELGGNAAVMIHDDADLERATQRCAFGAFAYAGQICISVQKLLVQQSIFDAFRRKFLEQVQRIVVGDPNDARTLVGPLINQEARIRIESWLQDALTRGARVIHGGRIQGTLMLPTVVENCPEDAPLSCNEAFAPVVLIQPYQEIADAISTINRSRFGLQAGLFTDSNSLVDQCFRSLEVGGLIVNEIPTYRADHMPYGGVKDSGLGREGLRYAMEEYCERRALVQWRG
jgi:glyceraldehyde-3-phosphate dehydrogenase (NADP+)